MKAQLVSKRGRYYHYMAEFDIQALNTLGLASTVMKRWAVGNVSEKRHTDETRSFTPLPFRAKVADIVNLLWKSAKAVTRNQTTFASSAPTDSSETPSDAFRVTNHLQPADSHDRYLA